MCSINQSINQSVTYFHRFLAFLHVKEQHSMTCFHPPAYQFHTPHKCLGHSATEPGYAGLNGAIEI